MKKGFVFIEVILSAIIASLVGIVLLHSQANNTSLLNHIFAKNKNEKLSSIALPMLEKRETASDKTAYELLNEIGIIVSNEDMVQTMKDTTINFSKTTYTQINLEDEMLDENVPQAAKQKQILIHQIDIEVNNKPTKYFSMEIAK